MFLVHLSVLIHFHFFLARMWICYNSDVSFGDFIGNRHWKMHNICKCCSQWSNISIRSISQQYNSWSCWKKSCATWHETLYLRYLPYQLVSRILSVNSGIMSSVLGPISQVGITTTRETRFEEATGCHDSWFQVGKFGCFNKWSWTRLEIPSPVFFSINKSIISTKRELFSILQLPSMSSECCS